MSFMRNFDRQYRISCGPAGGTGFEIGAVSGNTVPLHINFSIEKSDLEAQNTGKVDIWNLNNQHLSVIKEKDCVLSLRAGYGSRMPLIFAGIISHAKTSEDGPDRKTEIEVIDNLIEIRDTYVTLSYNGKVNWKTIFDDTATQLGVAISYSYNAEFVDITNGFSFVGQARDILTKGCKCCNLVWSIQNGIIQIKKPNDVMSKEVYTLSPDSGLLGIPAKVNSSQEETNGKTETGWDVVYFLNGAIHVDDYVKLESKTVTGYFRVYSISMTGDNVEGDWICKARLLEVKDE